MPDPVLAPPPAETAQTTQQGAAAGVSAGAPTADQGAGAAAAQGWTPDQIASLFNENGIDEQGLAAALERSQWLDPSDTPERIQQMRQAYDQYVQFAPHLTEFQKWQQEQQRAAQAAAEPEVKPLFQPVKYDGNYVGMERDAATGRWRSDNPADALRVQQANERLAWEAQLSKQFFDDPQGFIERAVEQRLSTVLKPLEEKFKPFEQFVQQAGVRDVIQDAYTQNIGLFATPDPKIPGQLVQTKAWDTFATKFDEMCKAQMPVEMAQRYALEMAKALHPQVAPAPAQRRGVNGVVVGANGDSRTFAQMATGVRQQQQHNPEKSQRPLNTNDPRYLRDVRNRSLAELGLPVPSN